MDILICDGLFLKKQHNTIKKLVKRNSCYLPVLLITTRHGIGAYTSGLWQLVDEMLFLPLVKRELQARVEMLLRAHRFSAESEERYFILAENNPVAMMLVHHEKIVYVNPALLEYTGEEERIAEVHVAGITYNRKPAQLVLLHDITSRKNYEKEIYNQRELLRKVMEAAPLGITRVDRSGRIVFANKTAEELPFNRVADTGKQVDTSCNDPQRTYYQQL